MNHGCYRIARSIFTWGILFMLLGSTREVAWPQYRVIGYYPMWASGTLPYSAIRYNALTHINHAFAWPNSNGSLAFDNPVVDTGLINTTHRAGRKILLSFGGAGATQTTNFSIVAADSNLRNTFIANVASYITANHYDGADLDWEGPATNSDKANEVLLVHGLRNAFHLADSSLLITMAVGAGDWSGQWRDYTSLKPYVDWFGVMTYDFYGSWSTTTGHNAPLYAPPGNTDGSVDQGVTYLAVTRGVPKSQIVLGLPFYGKEFTGTSALYHTYSSENDLAYSGIVASAGTGWTYNWDVISQVPYLTNASLPAFITYDDSSSLSNKCIYAKNRGLAGVMIWEISQDVIGQTQPLLDAVGLAMSGTSAVADDNGNILPTDVQLSQNYPNPFNPTTEIRYQVGGTTGERPGMTEVRLIVYDLLGREMARLVDETKPPGIYTVTFDATHLSSGTYFYRLTAGPVVQTRKMLVLK